MRSLAAGKERKVEVIMMVILAVLLVFWFTIDDLD